MMTMLKNMVTEVELTPILFTRTDTKEKSFFDFLRDLHVPHETIYVNTSRVKYLNPLRNIVEAIACFRRKQFDLIHTHGYRADLIGLIVSKYFGLPIVSTCHGYISNDRHLNLYNGLDVFLLRYFDRVIAVSDRMKNDLVGKRIDKRKIHVITNAVWGAAVADTNGIRSNIRSQLGIGNNEFVFGFVGRLSEEKGLGYLVEAVKRMPTGGEGWRLILLGEGPQRELLEKEVQDYGLGDKVLFVGFQADTAAWYPAMDAFVLPSLTEGTPMALLEAMANGVPVIASSVGGVPAILSNGENGILVPPADPTGLVEAMKAVAGSRELRMKLSDGAMRSVRENHDVNSWKRKVNEVYRTMVQENRSGR